MGSFAVFNADTSNILVIAENNWWGDDSGPDPYGSGEKINYRTCTNDDGYRYVCEYYVDANPWTGKTYNQSSTNGQDVSWQYYDADPVNTASGNYAYQQTDITIPIKGDLDLNFARSYNSLSPTTTGVMGIGWQHAYQITAEAFEEFILVTYGDGRQARFIITETGFEAPVGNFDTLTQEGDGTYRLLQKDQTLYAFDALGRISSMTDRNGHGLNFNYIGTNLSTIADTGGRALLSLAYTNSHLTKITDVIGRTVSYTYDLDDNLTNVTDVEGYTTSFTYDSNPVSYTHLTLPTN